MAASLDFDYIYVTDAAGDTVAASNAGGPISFVGVSFAFRDYFAATRSGRSGSEFGIGLVSKMPGLAFAAPVTGGGAILGAVIIKLNMSRLSHWVRLGNTLLTDENGIVVVASDPALVFTTFPAASWKVRDSGYLDYRYRRHEFTSIDLKPYRDVLMPGLVTLGASPVPLLLTSRQLKSDGISVHLLTPLHALTEVEAENQMFLWSLLVVGSLALMIVASSTVFAVNTRRNVRLLTHEITRRTAAEDEKSLRLAQLTQAQTELRGLTNELEARVHEEVAAREAAQLRAAHAERLHALGQLAGGIAHDFNNVLQAIQGAATLIERRPGNEAHVRRLARVAIEAAGQGASITRRLLAFGRRGDLRAETLDVAALFGDLREIFSYTLGAAIELDVRTGAGILPVFADKGQLKTVLVNLATNARDAMPEGGRLTLAAETEIVFSPDIDYSVLCEEVS